VNTLFAQEEMPRHFLILRLFVIVGSSILLLYAMVYGPGRGLTLILADDDRASRFHITRIAVYMLFLAGGITSAKRPLLASILLAMGLIGRAMLETTVSLGRQWMAYFTEFTPGESIFVPVFYMLSFALPALLCLDSFRAWRFLHKRATKTS
jgi:hypothetical protein